MSVTISPPLRDALLNMHDAASPFVERDGKTFFRFDSITVSQWADHYEATYSWRGHEVVTQRIGVADTSVVTPRLRLGGFTGEMEVTIT